MPTDEIPALEGEPQELEEERPGSSGLIGGLAFLLALGALVLSGWVWWEAQGTDNGQSPELQARLDRLEQAQADHTRQLAELDTRLEAAATNGSNRGEALEELESSLAEQRDRTGALQQELETQQSYTRSLQRAIESMQARLMAAETSLAAKPPGRNDVPEQLDLAGVEYLLRLAPERLSLFHDLRSADEALALADVRLQAMDNPMHIGLRRHIAEARQALAETELPNPVEISARLDAVQGRLSGLRFAGQVATAGETAETAPSPAREGQGWWERLKASLAGLVTVRRSAAEAESRLTLEDKDLLRQGLWMQIEGARLAMMRHDQAAWEDALGRAMAVLDRWFDESSAEYEAVYAELAALSDVDVSPELPDISGPWAQLQLIRQAPGTPPPETVEPEPGPTEAGADEEGEAAGSQAEPDEQQQDDSG